MAFYLGLVIFSFIITSVSLVPFIDILYKLRFIYSPILKIKSSKAGTPIGGGILIVSLLTILFAAIFPLVSRLGLPINSLYPLKQQLNIIFFTWIIFALVGLYDDLIKTFHLPYKYRHKTLLQIVASLVVAILIYVNLNLNFVYIPFIGSQFLGIFFIPVCAGIIFVFTRGVDISDGLDGLASGLLLICLTVLWAISVTTADSTISTFIALWLGSLIAFLYFNVYPARIWLGDSGSLAFGATLAVIGILLGKTASLVVIGGIFVFASWLKMTQRLFFKKSLTLHDWLLNLGWPEPKIVMRLWLAGGLLGLSGLWLASG